MNTTPHNLADLVARLQQREASVGAARNELNQNTVRTQVALHDTEQQLALCITGLTSAPRQIESEQSLLAELEGRRTIVLTKQSELEQQIADAPDWRTFQTGRERDTEFDRQQTLIRQLQLLRSGTLLVAPNQAYTRVEDLDARIRQSKDRIETLRAQLATDLQQGEALLAESVTQ